MISVPTFDTFTVLVFKTAIIVLSFLGGDTSTTLRKGVVLTSHTLVATTVFEVHLINSTSFEYTPVMNNLFLEAILGQLENLVIEFVQVVTLFTDLALYLGM